MYIYISITNVLENAWLSICSKPNFVFSWEYFDGRTLAIVKSSNFYNWTIFGGFIANSRFWYSIRNHVIAIKTLKILKVDILFTEKENKLKYIRHIFV